jgi:gentisate 1,2-dioxygenase
MPSRYERIIELAHEATARTKAAGPVIAGDSLEWETSHHGKVAYISEPAILGSNVQTMMMFIEELAPGGSNSGHRHLNEALVYILEGRGYSIIDGTRYDWKQGDTIAVPLMSWHQHFNADPERRVVFLGATNEPLLRSMGLFEMEDAPGQGHAGHGSSGGHESDAGHGQGDED